MDPKNMEPVHNFTNELFSLYDHKIPISKAKMAAITKLAMKAIKFYKHVVQNVEKFILKCKPEYKIPGLYVIDSIVRQSRHQFGPEKDVFAPRFARNMEDTFAHLFRCSQEDKSKIIRVLNLWQKNNVFAPEVIQPLFDLANPDHPVHQAFMQQQPPGQADMSNGVKRDSPQKEEGAPETLSTANVQKFQQLLMQQSASMDVSAMESSKFAPLMDYNDHGSDYEDEKVEQLPNTNIMHFNNFNNFSKFLGDPNITKQLENIKQMDVQRYLNDIPSASGSLFDPSQQQGSGITLANINSLRGQAPQENKDQDVEFIADFSIPEVIPINSRSPTPTRHKRRKSRSRSKSRDRGRYRRRRSRSRSRSRSYSRSPRNKHRSSRDRAREKEREAEKERRRKGLPDIKKDHLSVCSTTLWVGHLSKLVQQEELSDTFGKYGDIISIDMIPPRGCAYIVMNRRQDAYKAMQSLKNHKMQNRTITISWAAGKGVKSKEWKDYFDQTLGVTYIPFSKLVPTTDFVILEEGGMYDDETMPIWVKEKLKQTQTQTLVNKDAIFPQFFPQSIDTSQPPPNASMLPTMPSFSLGARPLLVPTQGMLGLGVPPPNMLMPGMIFPTPSDFNKIQSGLMGFSLPTSNQQPVLPSAQLQQPPNDDQMDIEMDDESSSSKNDGNNITMAHGFFNQPPPMNIQNLLMQNQLQNEHQNDSSDYSRMSGGNRNNRSQSREREGRDFRRGMRDRNDRRSSDFNRNPRWSNDTNGDRNRSRGGDDSNNNFNRRHQQHDIPSLLSTPMPLMDEPINSRQRNNDFGREEFDRRGGFRGGFQQRNLRGNRGGQFNNRGGMRGFHNNNFNNDRQSGNSYDSNRRGGRWRDDDDRRNFGSYDRKSSNRWNDRSENWDENDSQQQQPSVDLDHDDSKENFKDEDDDNLQQKNNENNTSEDNENFTTKVDDYVDDQNDGEMKNDKMNRCDAEEVNIGNTTPLCDEDQVKE